MTTIIRCLIAALLAVLITVGCWLCAFLATLNSVAADLPGVLDQAVAREGNLTRKMIQPELAKLNQTAATLAKDVPERAETQIAELRTDLNEQLSTLNATLDRRAGEVTSPAGKTITQFQALFPPVQNTIERVSETADLALDCDHNADCAYNRYVGTARSIEKTSASVQRMAGAVEKVTPQTAAAFQSTSKDLSVIVARFARPVSAIKGLAGTALHLAGKFLGF